jgi:hypothetical protein
MMALLVLMKEQKGAILMRQDGSNNRGSETIWRTKGKNLEEKEKIYGAQDENLWRTTPDKD